MLKIPFHTNKTLPIIIDKGFFDFETIQAVTGM
jgi:hypothetical protein